MFYLWLFSLIVMFFVTRSFIKVSEEYKVVYNKGARRFSYISDDEILPDFPYWGFLIMTLIISLIPIINTIGIIAYLIFILYMKLNVKGFELNAKTITKALFFIKNKKEDN